MLICSSQMVLSEEMQGVVGAMLQVIEVITGAMDRIIPVIGQLQGFLLSIDDLNLVANNEFSQVCAPHYSYTLLSLQYVDVLLYLFMPSFNLHLADQNKSRYFGSGVIKLVLTEVLITNMFWYKWSLTFCFVPPRWPEDRGAPSLPKPRSSPSLERCAVTASWPCLESPNSLQRLSPTPPPPITRRGRRWLRGSRFLEMPVCRTDSGSCSFWGIFLELFTFEKKWSSSLFPVQLPSVWTCTWTWSTPQEEPLPGPSSNQCWWDKSSTPLTHPPPGP